MSKEVLFVDDLEPLVRAISRVIEKKGFNPVTFTDFDKALDYVVKRGEEIYACFVDMKPLGIIRIQDENSLTNGQKRILDLPERIFEEVKSKGWQERFYFISGHRSKHDQEVLDRTGANYLEKDDLGYRIKKILS